MKEKIIQFGEGGFLRGFADWMIQKVNDEADFGGSVVVVQPIENGMCDETELDKLKILMSMAQGRMGQVEDREATPEEENMFLMASLM